LPNIEKVENVVNHLEKPILNRKFVNQKFRDKEYRDRMLHAKELAGQAVKQMKAAERRV
jgi:hypothetical protein